MTVSRAVFLMLAIAAAPWTTSAQDINIQQQQQRVQPPGPARDQAAAKTGTAVIRGRVFAADTGRPLRRAKITANAQELGPDGRTTSTNPDGRYEIKDLPAGRYNIAVARSGYLQLRYGQRRPLEQGKPLQLLDKQLMDNVDFSLPRMSLITGRVYDEANEPISGVSVMALRSMFFEGKRKLVMAGPMVNTDDAGQYRMLGLSPGTYYVMASMRDTWTVTDNGVETTMGYSPTYFPGTPSSGEASRLTVGIGQEVSNIDLTLIPGRAANVSGTALDSHRQPLTGRNISLGQEFRGPQSMMMFSNSGAPVGADGSFTIKNVPPGEYKLTVSATTPGRTATPTTIPESAAATIVVAGVDIDNVSLITSAGWSVSGQLVAENGGPPTMPRERLSIAGRAMQPDVQPRSVIGNGPDNGRVKDDWTFTVGGLFGPVLIRPNLPDGWIVRAIVQNDRDITDTPIEMKSGEEFTGVQVVVSNRPTTVTGQLLDDKGNGIADGTVIVFPTEAEKWMENSRFVRSARPDQQGQYQIKGLPPGDYLAVAVDYVQEGMWNDPEYLESIRRYGQKLTLAEAASQPTTLKIVKPEG
jgi:protocatechuate 3,4-dioxygenase beta subunit